jgi:hypothetical protein
VEGASPERSLGSSAQSRHLLARKAVVTDRLKRTCHSEGRPHLVRKQGVSRWYRGNRRIPAGAGRSRARPAPGGGRSAPPDTEAAAWLDPPPPTAGPLLVAAVPPLPRRLRRRCRRRSALTPGSARAESRLAGAKPPALGRSWLKTNGSRSRAAIRASARREWCRGRADRRRTRRDRPLNWLARVATICG